MNNIYLDNSATTQASAAAIQAAVEAMRDCYGNPSSAHSKGTEAAEVLNRARNELFCALLGEKIKAQLPARAALRSPVPKSYGKLYFTGSGTEANNLAIFGAAYQYRASPSKYKLITSDSEHPSVLQPFERLKHEGFRIAYIRTENGVLDIEQLRAELTPDTILFSCMLANNETGALYDLKTAFSLARTVSPNIICHTDAIQAFQKTQFTADALGADMVSVSGHKIHAPKGVGALWVNEKIARKAKLSPVTLGGGQEESIRSGTENLPGIAAFAAAVKDNGGSKAGSVFECDCSALRELLIENLPSGVTENRPTGNFLPHIISLTLPIPRSQPMINYLSANGIYVSAGSACSTGKTSVSHVLLSFGLKENTAASTIRVSLDRSTTKEDILTFCDVLGAGVKKLYGERK